MTKRRSKRKHQLWRPLVASVVSLPMILGVAACKGGNAAQRLANSTAPTLESVPEGKCKPGSGASKPLVVEWPMAERAALEGKAKQSLVAVRYRNCEMEVINTCSVAGDYAFTSVTPKSENIRITNADELYAKIPVGAVKLEGKLARDGQLNVDMVLVGRYEADRYRFSEVDLNGRCEGATHVVTGMSVGAFEFYSGAGADIGISGGAKGTGIEAGAGSKAHRELLNRDGDPKACGSPSQEVEIGVEEGEEAKAAPPPGCGALIRVEVVPIDFPQPTTTSSSGTVTNLTETNAIAGENMTTGELDRRIKTMAFVALSSYAIATAGVLTFVFGLRINSGYSSEATDIGMAGSDERLKYISRYKTSLGMVYGGIGGAVIGIAAGLGSTIHINKLRNERSTRLAGFGISPLPGGGVFAGAAIRF